MNAINLEILINNILKVLFFLIIFGIIIFISMKGLNTIFIKAKQDVNKSKTVLNDRLENLNIKINPELFNFLVKIQKIFENKNILIFIISILLIILWFYIFYRLLNNYFNDSEVMKYKGINYNIKHIFDSIYSNFEKSKWLNYSENNYISENGKLCKLSPVNLDSCIGNMINKANNLVFTKSDGITPEFIENGILDRFQKIMDNLDYIYILDINEDIEDNLESGIDEYKMNYDNNEENSVINLYNSLSGSLSNQNIFISKPNKIKNILYNDKKLTLENDIRDNVNKDNTTTLINIDDSRILYSSFLI